MVSKVWRLAHLLYKNGWVFFSFVCLVGWFFYGFYHGKSFLFHHHVGNMFGFFSNHQTDKCNPSLPKLSSHNFFPTTFKKSKFWFSFQFWMKTKGNSSCFTTMWENIFGVFFQPPNKQIQGSFFFSILKKSGYPVILSMFLAPEPLVWESPNGGDCKGFFSLPNARIKFRFRKYRSDLPPTQ